MPKVSVLMPAYNHEHYIGEAVESVLGQSLADWELIVVDDGSTDHTAEIIHAIHDPRVLYLYQNNQGCPAALNSGYRNATGDFISILASDDLLLPCALATLSEALQVHTEADVVYGDGYVIDEHGRVVDELASYRRMPFGDTLDSMVVASPVVGVHSAMIRRKVLEQLQGPFDEHMLGYEDWDLFVRIKVLGSRFINVPRPVCSYRFHGANKSAPLSGLSEQRRKALTRKRFKEMNASWFGSLSLPARSAFFEDFLSATLQGDRILQAQVVEHHSFASLPSKARSALLYRLAVSNIIATGAAQEDRKTLFAAVRLYPGNVKAYALSVLLLLGNRLAEGVLLHWRRAKTRSESSDPVTQILRSKNVA